MATEVGNIYYDLDLNDDKFQQGSKRVKGELDGMGGAFKKAEGASMAFTAVIAGIGAGLVAFAADSFGKFQESERVITQLNAVLASTKSAAGVSAKAVTDYATKMQSLTGINDEAIISQQNMLLTFTGVGKNVFKQASTAVLDMTTALNGGLIPSEQELQAKTILLGKALQDPDAGLGALKRVGVNTDELAVKLAGLTSKEEKQKAILQELSTEFGGSAEAAGKTFAGQLAIARNTFDDFQELIGKSLNDALRPLVQWFNDLMASMGGPEGMFKALTDTIQRLIPFMPIIIGFIIGGMTPAFIALAGAIWAAISPLLPFIAIGVAIGALVMLLIDAFGGWNNVLANLKDAWDLIVGLYNQFLKPALEDLWRVITAELLPELKELWKILSPVLVPVLQFLAVLIIGTVVVALKVIIEVLKIVIQHVSDWVKGINEGITFIKHLFSDLPGHIERALSRLVDIITSPFKEAWKVVSEIAEKIAKAMDKINPFHRESPSLVDNVTNGVAEIIDQYSKLNSLNFPTVALAPAQSGSTTNQNIYVNVDKVDSKQDINALGQEIGFRIGIQPK